MTKLLYIYVQKYHVLRDAELNFDSNVRFRFERDDRMPSLHMDVTDSVLPDLFSLKPGGKRIDATALIGSNGAGKTSVATFIRDFLSGHTDVGNSIVVVQTGEKECVAYHTLLRHGDATTWLQGGVSEEMHWVDLPVVASDGWTVTSRPIRENLDRQELRDRLCYIYYSPFLSSQHPFDAMETNVTDISTAGLLLNARDLLGNTKFSKQVNLEQFDAFRLLDTIDVLEFVALKKPNPPASFPNPRGCSVGINSSVYELSLGVIDQTLQKLRGEAKEKLEELRRREREPRTISVVDEVAPDMLIVQTKKRDKYTVSHYAGRLGPLLDDRQTLQYWENRQKLLAVYARRLETVMGKGLRHDMFLKAFMVFCVLWLRDLNFEKEMDGPSPAVFRQSFCRRLIAALYGILRYDDKHEFTQENHIQLRRRVLAFFERSIRNCNRRIESQKNGGGSLTLWSRLQSARIVFERLYERTVGNETPSGGYLSFSFGAGDNTALCAALEIVQNHAQSRIVTDYLTFSISPNLSAGEMSLLTMFGRLHRAYKRIVRSRRDGRKNLLLYMDEAETTLHPTLQRNVVALMIWYADVFLKGVNVQVVFASHSPIILSDFPKGNAIFLERDQEANVTHVKEFEERNLSNTFGADVFSLYRWPYFMKDGFVGRVASEWLKRMVQTVKYRVLGCGPNTKRERKRVLTDAQLAQLTRMIGDENVRCYFAHWMDSLSGKLSRD